MSEKIVERSEDAPVLTPKNFEAAMRGASEAYQDDPEAFHTFADGLMCRLLRSLGYEAGVAVFQETPKWYA